MMARANQTPGMRPRQTLGRQLDVATRHAFPAVSTIVLMLLAEIPFGFASQATLLPAHPRMKQLNADLAGLNRQIRTEVGKIVDGLEREAKVSAMREEGVRRSLEEFIRMPVDTIDPRSAAALTDRIVAAPALLDALAPLVGLLLRDREGAAA